MKKVVLVAAPVVMAAETSSKAEKVACCHWKGKCDNKHTKADCEKEGGKVVKDCKGCK
jgi:hypothetical protein